MLKEVVDHDGVMCAFVATRDGFVVEAEADTGVDPEEPAAIASTILLRTKSVMNRLIPEHLEEEKAKVSVVCGHPPNPRRPHNRTPLRQRDAAQGHGQAPVEAAQEDRQGGVRERGMTPAPDESFQNP